MKVLTSFKCEICGREDSDINYISRCEARGVATPFPQYLIFSEMSRGAMYRGLVFCIATVSQNGHSFGYGLWAARDTAAGDNYGKQLCGSGGELILPKTAPNRDQPAFERMVDYVKSKAVPALVWDGEKAVPLRHFLRRKS